MFDRPPYISVLREPNDKRVLEESSASWESWQSAAYLRSQAREESFVRKDIPLPEVITSHFPSNPRAQTIVADKPLEAWQELLFVISRFGHPVKLAKGERLELQNLKVVVEQPAFEPDEALRACHFDPIKLRAYQRDFIRGEKGADETYSYGHRLRAYFGADNLAACLRRLQADPEDRKAYLTLWDNRRDLEVAKGQPCFVSLFFRRFDEKLTLTATFRTHNALDAWLPNVYGLMAVQQWVALELGLPPGPITVVSHSISIDRKELDRALAMVSHRGLCHPGGPLRLLPPQSG